MADVAPEDQDAVEKLTARVSSAGDESAGGGGPNITGSLKLSSPNFLSKKARQDLYRAMVAAGFVTVVLAVVVILQSHTDTNDNWTGPTTMLLFVGLAAWAIAYFTAAGFGNVEVVVGDPQPPANGDNEKATGDAVLHPAKDEKDVATDTEVTAVFPSALDAGTVKGSSFTLTKQGESSAVPATVTYDVATMTAKLKPTTTLSSATTFTASLADTILDSEGKAIIAIEWTFITK